MKEKYSVLGVLPDSAMQSREDFPKEAATFELTANGY